MREQIAVLDGLGAVPGWDGRHAGPVPGNGQNYSGGSNYPDAGGFPYSPQQEGLAGLEGLGTSLGVEAMPPGYAGSAYTPSPSSGANYQGGSNWHPYTPTVPSSEGLAGSLSIESVPGYAGHTVGPVPGGGANYTGGSDWFPGAPTKIPSEGLVGLRGPLAPLRRGATPRTGYVANKAGRIRALIDAQKRAFLAHPHAASTLSSMAVYVPQVRRIAQWAIGADSPFWEAAIALAAVLELGAARFRSSDLTSLARGLVVALNSDSITQTRAAIMRLRLL